MERFIEPRGQGTALTPFGTWVSRQANLLVRGGTAVSGIRHEGYLKDGPYATAALARLRRSVGHAVGADPDIFEWTLPDLEIVSGSLAMNVVDTEATSEELAAHAALTLLAVHQQSIHDASMHTDDYVSFGRAVGRLAYGNVNEAGIRRAFDRLQTSNGWKELVRHARELVTLLKRERIALNYGLFAQDLVRLRGSRERSNGVMLRWGRDFQRAYAALSRDDKQDS